MTIRILSGLYAKKPLECPKEDKTRPTSAKVREAIFNVLNHLKGHPHLLKNAVVLDAFAGSGVLGLEALSQGASRAYFLEKDPQVFKTLLQNIRTVQGQEGTAYPMRKDCLNPPVAPEPCDLLFLDPPYDRGFLEKSMKSLKEQGWFHCNSFFVFEISTSEKVPPLPFIELLFDRSYGSTRILIGKHSMAELFF